MNKRLLSILLSALFLLVFSSACNKSKDPVVPESKYKINVPTYKVTQQLGMYEITNYFVMDENYLVLTDYVVQVDGVVDPDGNAVALSNGRFQATKVGVYKITFKASYVGSGESETVNDAVLEVEFTKPQDTVVAQFDEYLPNDLYIWNTQATVSYTQERFYNEERGSLKVTSAKAGEIYVSITSPEQEDLTAYDYVLYRVYNPTNSDVEMGFCWCADTVCPAGEWTEVKADLNDVYGDLTQIKFDNVQTGYDIPRDNVSGLALRVISGLSVGQSVYISAVYAVCK